MPAFICTACGTQYPPSEKPPALCRICEEERQYVPPRGQSWTTLDALRLSHMNSYREYEPNVIGIGSQPSFAIGQRALLVRTPGGNILWDCIATLDDATVTHDQGSRRHPGDRHLASAFLHHDGRVGARLRLPDPSQRRRPGLDRASVAGGEAVARRHASNYGTASR